MGEWFNARREAMTLERYRQLDADGKITRPLSLGHMERRYAVVEGMDVQLPGHMTVREVNNRAEVQRRSRAKAKTRKEAA